MDIKYNIGELNIGDHNYIKFGLIFTNNKSFFEFFELDNSLFQIINESEI